MAVAERLAILAVSLNTPRFTRRLRHLPDHRRRRRLFFRRRFLLGQEATIEAGSFETEDKTSMG